jgi:dTDP-glucose 4,6-dehydratase
MMVERYPDYHIVNLDKLTYAGNLENLKGIESAENYTFVRGDITDAKLLDSLFAEYAFDGVIHLAAESHVDRSIENPLAFIETNVVGTVQLLSAAQRAWAGDLAGKRLYHVSTDEVYGSLGPEGYFTEATAYDPRSPYSASKASSDHFVRAWHHTYGLPVVLSNCSNNYGPYQFPEKLIPLMINNIRHGKNLPVYGDGSNIRDWLWVGDHVAAIDLVFHRGRTGDGLLDRPTGTARKLITFVKDRPGHDQRYAIDADKIKKELGWEPSISVEEGLAKTAAWYLEQKEWLEHVTSGAYQEYYERHYNG